MKLAERPAASQPVPSRRRRRRRGAARRRRPARPDRPRPRCGGVQPVRPAHRHARRAHHARRAAQLVVRRRASRAARCCSRSTASRWRRSPSSGAIASAARPGDVLTLYLYAPEHQPAPARRPVTRRGRTASDPDPAMPKSRILVIDDEAAIRDSLKMTLEYAGYEFVGAATGQEGARARRARSAGRRAARHQDAGHGRHGGARAGCGR